MPWRAVLISVLAAVLTASSGGNAVADGQLEVTVTEGAGDPVPCRVHLTAGGKPVYAPGMPRFERDPHFSCPGCFTVAVPPGKVRILIERGLEYRPFSEEISVEAGQTVQRRVPLERWIDMNQRGWYSGDLHVHRPPADMPLLLRADDVNVAPVLTFWNKNAGTVAPPYLVEGRDEGTPPRPRCFHILAQEDERAGGAILLFNLAKPILLEGVTRDYPSGFAYHEAALGQKAFVEVEKPFWWEAPVHVALGRVDSMGLVCNHFQRTQLMDNEAWGRPRDRAAYAGPMGFARNVMDLYYRYLNMGYQIAASAGSATGVLANPLGQNRTYVPLERFSYEGWFAAMREGRNFVTNGPMLFATVSGKPIGTRFDVPAGPFEATVEFEALGRDPLEKAEIVVGGEVAASFTPPADNPRRIAARRALPIGRSTWIAVRAFEPVQGSVVRFAHSSPFYVTIGGARPSDPEAARFYVQWLDELIRDTEKKQAAAGSPAPFDPVLATYRRARAVYQAAAGPPQ
jgi:hypothetical protein